VAPSRLGVSGGRICTHHQIVRCLTRQRGEPKAERGGMLILLLMTKRENERKPKYVDD
jgi:hypothetical protein